MNGTKLKDHPLKFQTFFKKFTQDFKVSEGRLLKVLVCILLSNLFLYLLLNMNETPEVGPSYSPTNRPDYAWIEVPLVTHLPLLKHSETMATLLDENNHPICEKIYVAPVTMQNKSHSSSSKDSWNFSDSDTTTGTTLIQVPNIELMKVVKGLVPGRVFKAVPVMDISELKGRGPIQRGKEYEIQF